MKLKFGSVNDLTYLCANLGDNPYDFGDKKFLLSTILSSTLRAAAVDAGLLEVVKIQGVSGMEDTYILKNPVLSKAFMNVSLVKGEVIQTIEKLLEPIEYNSYLSGLEKLKQFKM